MYLLNDEFELKEVAFMWIISLFFFFWNILNGVHACIKFLPREMPTFKYIGIIF